MYSGDGQTSFEERACTGVVGVSRRDFLKRTVAALASAAGIAGGLGGLFSGCVDSEVPSNTTATVHPGASTTKPVTTSSPTTVAVDIEKGRDIKVGVVSAATGPLALCGRADEWWSELAAETLADGIVCGDGRLHRPVVIIRDSGSEPEGAERAAVRLMLEAKVDIVLCSGGTGLVLPVAAQAERLLCPCLCSFVQWRRFVAARGSLAHRPFAWTYAHALDLEDIFANFIAMWGQLTTNRKVGFVFADDSNGRAWTDSVTGLSPAAAGAGYECVFPGLYPVANGDFEPYLSEFKRSGCEILCGAFSVRDFIDFWRQLSRQDYRPKIVTVGGALLFPHALEAVGPSARNLTAECLWQPEWPYRDSITGKTCRELAGDYMATTGDQWTPAVAQYALFEWAVDVLKRVTDLDSREEIVGKVLTTELNTCLGLIDFTEPVVDSALGGRRPAKNVYKAPVGAAQWVKGDVFGFEPLLLTAVNSKELSPAGSLRPLEYGRGT